MIVRVFPGGDKGEFTLYEDNGEDKHYRNEYATTPLSYSRQGNTLKVTIGARKGSYKDIPAQRQYSIALPCQKAPTKVTCQGKELPFSYDGMNLETLIDLGKIDCASDAVVEVEMPAEYVLVDGMKASFRHIQTMVRDFKQHDAGMVYTEDFGYLEATPLRLSYHPEKQEETLSAFKEKFKNITKVLIEQMGLGDHYKRAIRQLNMKDALTEVPATAFQSNGKAGFSVRFFNNKNINGNAVANISLDHLDAFWSGSPCEGVTPDGWSLIAESEFTAPTTGDVMLSIAGDDGYRLIVDGKELCGDWSNHAETSRLATFKTTKGQKHTIYIEHYDNEFNASLRLRTMMIVQDY